MSSVYEHIRKFNERFPGGIAWRVKKHAQVIEDYLDNDEEVLYAFCGQKNDSFSDIFNTFVFVLTNKRLLMGHKRLIWGSFLYTVTPELYNDMQIYSGLIWGKITIDTVKEVIVISNLPKRSLDEIETNVSTFMYEAKKKYVKNQE